MSNYSSTLPSQENCTIAVIGLGYVGLPLSVGFASVNKSLRSHKILRRNIIAFDIDENRIAEIRRGYDRTNEISSTDLCNASNLLITNDHDSLNKADVFIVTVPTPIDSARRPDFTPLQKASKRIALALKARAENSPTSVPIVIYESTVYPGATEEICVPILEENSGLTYNEGFFCGYSPERINPGDITRRLTDIVKVTSGSTPQVASFVDDLYGSIIRAGTHAAPSIKVAEAAKVIENTQRDINIALVNELSKIFHRLNIDTLDVLEASRTKWNFLDFRPGLVGGHCIGVDPYYLTHKAEQLGYHPEIVLAGRRINDSMSSWVVDQLVLKLSTRGLPIRGLRVLILGLTFKENCPDMRNTRVVDVITQLRQYGLEPVIVDPWVDKKQALEDYSIHVHSEIPSNEQWSAVVLAVAHKEFKSIQAETWSGLMANDGVLIDLKGVVPRAVNAFRL